MSKWIYLADGPATLVDGELVIDLEPGVEFEAPDDWEPRPNAESNFKRVSSKPAPATAPEE